MLNTQPEIAKKADIFFKMLIFSTMNLCYFRMNLSDLEIDLICSKYDSKGRLTSPDPQISGQTMRPQSAANSNLSEVVLPRFLIVFLFFMIDHCRQDIDQVCKIKSVHSSGDERLAGGPPPL
jgi:hypothetical protein